MSRGGKLTLTGVLMFIVSFWLTDKVPTSSTLVAFAGLLSLIFIPIGIIMAIVDNRSSSSKSASQRNRVVDFEAPFASSAATSVESKTPVVDSSCPSVKAEDKTLEELTREKELLAAKIQLLEKQLELETLRSQVPQAEPQVIQVKTTYEIPRASQQKKEKTSIIPTIVSTAIVDTSAKSKTKASATSSVVRGAVGGMLFGPIGMVAGAVTPKKKTVTNTTTVTFAILYSNGHRKTETVKVGSFRYKELSKYLA